MGTSKTPDDISFEDAFSRLETLADRLESGDLSLEESMKAFEQGMSLVRICSGQLDAAETKLKKLVKDESGFQLELMEPAD